MISGVRWGEKRNCEFRNQIGGWVPGGIPGGFLDGGVSPPGDASSRPTIVEV